jgi:hypothetical protein
VATVERGELLFFQPLGDGEDRRVDEADVVVCVLR